MLTAKPVAARQPTDVARVASRVVGRLRARYPQGAAITLALPGDDVSVRCLAPARLERALAELLLAMSIEDPDGRVELQLTLTRLQLPAARPPPRALLHALLQVRGHHVQWPRVQLGTVRQLLGGLGLRFSIQAAPRLGATVRIYLPHEGSGHDDV